MGKLIVKAVDRAPEVEATHKDLGLCYVDQIDIGPVTILVVITKEENPNNYASIRVEKVKLELAKRGFYWNGIVD